MAASKHTYTTNFVIGAKLAGTFRATVASAQSRMKALNHGALHLAEGFKHVAAHALTLTGILGGLAGAKVFESIFEGANEAVEEAENRERKLGGLLMMNTKIRKRGLEYAHEAAESIITYNRRLATQGVLSRQVLDTMAAQTAAAIRNPKEIAKLQKPLANTLVTMQGINASQEDARKLAYAVGLAITGGQIRSLGRVANVISKEDRKRFQDAKSVEERYQAILTILSHFPDANVKALGSAEGKIHELSKAVLNSKEDIGFATLAVRGELAKAWTDLLPVAKPFIIAGVKFMSRSLRDFANYVRTSIVPQMEPFKAWLSGPFNDALTTVKKTFSDMTKKVGPEFVKMWQSLGGKGKDFKSIMGEVVVGALKKLAQAFKWIGDNASWLVPLVGKLVVGFISLDVALSAIALFNPLTLFGVGVAGAIIGVTTLNQHLDDLRARNDSIGGLARDLKALDDKLRPFVETFKTNFVQSWIDLGTNIKIFDDWLQPWVQTFSVNFIKSFKDMGDNIVAFGKILEDWLLKPLRDIEQVATGAIKNVTNVITNRLSAPGGPMYNGPIAPAANAMGGIIRKPMLSTLAENGPEVVIPLNNKRRSKGLLDYANRALGKVNLDAPTTITFAPVINIDGNADETAQRALDSRLRDLQRDFFNLFTYTQRQQRRLSFQSGYA